MHVKDTAKYTAKLLGDVQYLRKKLIKLSYLLGKQEAEDLYFSIYNVENLTEKIVDELIERNNVVAKNNI